MAKSIVGVDIGGTSIRAVEVERFDRPNPVVVRFAEIPLPSGASTRGEVTESNTVAGVLRDLWKLGRFSSKRVVLGMGNQRVLSRDLTVPKAPIAQIRESLPFQVQDMLPVPVGDAILDFYPIAESVAENGPVVHGLLIAAIKDAVLANVKAVQLAGLTPMGVDLIPFALTRVFLPASRTQGTFALVEMGENTTTVVIATNGVPEFVRIIPTGGGDQTRALSGRLDITEPEAEIVKRYIGLGGAAQTPDDARAAAVVQDLVGELTTSLRNTINYFVSTHADRVVEGIVLAGGGAALPGFALELQRQTLIAVTMGDPFRGATLARSISAQNVAEHGPSIAVAWALAVGSKAA
jgi:type IV pilus assembly protein PilM